MRKPSAEAKLVHRLTRLCPSFVEFWSEVGSIYSAASPMDAPPSDALAEFARHPLELYQDGRRNDLALVVGALRELIAAPETRELGIDLLRAIEADWSDSMSSGRSCFNEAFASARGAV